MLKKIEFTILAVWNFYWACKQGRFKNVKGEDCLEWSAIRHYQSILKDPSIVIGDWNFGPTFSQDAFVKMVNMFEEIGLKAFIMNIINYQLQRQKTSLINHQ